MNKYFKFICISVVMVMVISVGSSVVGAQSSEGLLSVQWYTDYSNPTAPELKIDMTSSAGYIPHITVVMYDDDFDALTTDNKPGFADYYGNIRHKQ